MQLSDSYIRYTAVLMYGLLTTRHWAQWAAVVSDVMRYTSEIVQYDASCDAESNFYDPTNTHIEIYFSYKNEIKTHK